MNGRLLTWILAGMLAAGAQAATYDEAAKSAKSDLDKALAELALLEQQIAAEKLPLAREQNRLEDELLAKRREAERAQRLRGSKTLDLENLRAEVKARRDENVYVTSLLDEYMRAFETRIHIAEVQRYRPAIEEAKLALEDVNISAAEKLRRQVALVKTSIQRMKRNIGGDRFEGQALTEEGKMEAGTFLLAGPVVVFAGAPSERAGIVELQLGSPEPSLLPIGKDLGRDIRELTAKGAGQLPLDASLGSAVKIAQTRESILEHARKGGPVMVPIIALAAVALLVGIFKWIQLAGVRVARPQDLQEVLELVNRGDLESARKRAEAVRGPAGQLLAVAVQHSKERKALIEEVMYEKLLETKPKLERLLALIALTAATEPLLGLLGTVTGIIRTFKLITVFGTGDPKLLSSGISEALITTEFGLYFAIPCLLAHALLSRKVKRLLASMEQTAVGFVNGLNREC
jgi:biopolymer transport protein ExbB